MKTTSTDQCPTCWGEAVRRQLLETTPAEILYLEIIKDCWHDVFDDGLPRKPKRRERFGKFLLITITKVIKLLFGYDQNLEPNNPPLKSRHDE